MTTETSLAWQKTDQCPITTTDISTEMNKSVVGLVVRALIFTVMETTTF